MFNDIESILSMFNLGLPVFLIALGYVAGRFAERRHYRSIGLREEAMKDIITLTVKRVPAHLQAARAELVWGSVVISHDYFKAFAMSLRKLVGGRLRGYESLLDRARREAVLRLKDEAAKVGASMVINLRFETSSISKGKGLVSVEVMAYGTALSQ